MSWVDLSLRFKRLTKYILKQIKVNQIIQDLKNNKIYKQLWNVWGHFHYTPKIHDETDHHHIITLRSHYNKTKDDCWTSNWTSIPMNIPRRRWMVWCVVCLFYGCIYIHTFYIWLRILMFFRLNHSKYFDSVVFFLLVKIRLYFFC